MKIKVYLAAKYRRRFELAKYRDELQAAGIHVTSRWLDGEEQLGRQSRQAYAMIDLYDIDLCDILILFSETPENGYYKGGRMCEFGYALAKGKQQFIVGKSENIFTEMNHVRQFDTWSECLETLTEMQRIKTTIEANHEKV